MIVPRTGIDLSVTGGFVAEQTEVNAENRWVVYGTPGRPLAFSWKRKIDDRRATMPLRVRSRITQLVALGEDKALRAGLGDFFVDYYLKLKQAEIDRFNSEVSDWEQREYFSLF